MALEVRQSVLWDVQEEVRRVALLNGPRAISIRNLVDRGVGSESEIVAALMALRDIGLVAVYTIIRCPDCGGEAWRGKLEEVNDNLYKRCRECGRNEAHSAEDVRFKFAVSDAFAERFAAQKKSPQLLL